MAKDLRSTGWNHVFFGRTARSLKMHKSKPHQMSKRKTFGNHFGNTTCQTALLRPTYHSTPNGSRAMPGRQNSGNGSPLRLIWKDFDGHNAFQACVAGAVNFTILA